MGLEKLYFLSNFLILYRHKDSDESKYIVREVAEILVWYRTELIIRICLAIV